MRFWTDKYIGGFLEFVVVAVMAMAGLAPDDKRLLP